MNAKLLTVTIRICVALAFTVTAGFRLVGADPTASPLKGAALNPTQVEALVGARKDVVILDVRTPEERSGGFISGSTNIDFRAPDFHERLAKLDASRTYVVHCVRGQKRTTDTVAALKQLGVTNVVALEGGYNAWVQDGKPVQK